MDKALILYILILGGVLGPLLYLEHVNSTKYCNTNFIDDADNCYWNKQNYIIYKKDGSK